MPLGRSTRLRSRGEMLERENNDEKNDGLAMPLWPIARFLDCSMRAVRIQTVC